MSNDILKKYEHWLAEDGPAALVMREYLMPVEGKDAPVFPATFAASEDGEFKGGYNIDRFESGHNVCVIDSVGSQANRMEPLFKRETYKSLVPQIEIKAGAHTINLLDAGHRAADAVVRLSSLKDEIQAAFKAIMAKGDAEPLAKIAPTSLLFGVWDSRETGARLPRLLSSVIRAYDVDPQHRSAQYIPAIDYVAAGVVDEPADKAAKDKLAEVGLTHVPSSWKHGGVDVRGSIRRDTTLSLVGIRNLRASNPANTESLRRYILGLGLCAMTAPRTHDLRQGCLLVRDPKGEHSAKIVCHDGTTEALVLEPKTAVEYANAALDRFGIGQSRSGDKAVAFDATATKTALSETKEQKKANKRAAKG
jgi:CRISPR-associated protein Csb1